MPVTVEEIRQSFEGSSFLSHMGIEIVRFEEGNVVLKLNIEDYLLNVNKTLHGGVHATMLDTILGMVVRSVSKTRVTTTSLTIHYLDSLSAGEIFAEAKVLKLGYKIAFAEGEIKDANGHVIAKGTGSFKLIRTK